MEPKKAEDAATAQLPPESGRVLLLPALWGLKRTERRSLSPRRRPLSGSAQLPALQQEPPAPPPPHPSGAAARSLARSRRGLVSAAQEGSPGEPAPLCAEPAAASLSLPPPPRTTRNGRPGKSRTREKEERTRERQPTRTAASSTSAGTVPPRLTSILLPARMPTPFPNLQASDASEFSDGATTLTRRDVFQQHPGGGIPPPLPCAREGAC